MRTRGHDDQHRGRRLYRDGRLRRRRSAPSAQRWSARGCRDYRGDGRRRSDGARAVQRDGARDDERRRWRASRRRYITEAPWRWLPSWPRWSRRWWRTEGVPCGRRAAGRRGGRRVRPPALWAGRWRRRRSAAGAYRASWARTRRALEVLARGAAARTVLAGGPRAWRWRRRRRARRGTPRAARGASSMMAGEGLRPRPRGLGAATSRMARPGRAVICSRRNTAPSPVARDALGDAPQPGGELRRPSKLAERDEPRETPRGSGLEVCLRTPWARRARQTKPQWACRTSRSVQRRSSTRALVCRARRRPWAQQ